MKSTALLGDFTMPQYDEVSSKLGGIEATQTLILKSLHTIEDAYKETRDKTTLHGASLETLWKWKDETAQPLLDEYETTRDKGKGMWYVICAGWTFLSGLAGAWASKVFLP
jgi:hypothetical protein